MCGALNATRWQVLCQFGNVRAVCRVRTVRVLRPLFRTWFSGVCLIRRKPVAKEKKTAKCECGRPLIGADASFWGECDMCSSTIGRKTMNAWLHRKYESTWQFTANQAYGELVHITNRGTVYAIFANHKRGKPFWIGRRVVDAGGRIAWVRCEAQLRARSIKFEDAGVYIF